MTIEDLIAWLSARPLLLVGCLFAVPLVSGLAGLAHGKGGGAASPWKYLHSCCVYAACIPGMFSAVLTVYALFFRNANLLGVNVLVYFLPIVSMAATLLLTRRGVGSFDEVPGFGRLSGLMLMLGLSIGVAFALHRFHFGVFFLGPLAQLGTIAVVVFALLRLGARRLSGERRGGSIADEIRRSSGRDPR